MKKVLFILFSFLSFTISINAQFVSGNTEIMLTQKNGDREIGDKDSEITPEGAPQTRSSVFQPVCAYLYNKVITVDFQAAFSAVTVNVINEATGEAVCSKQLISPTSFSIDLSGKDAGDYMIEIISDKISLEGYFPL
ncbi:DUF3244 domain-containing protein [Bacteroides oleiciplenus]|uniref:DUF3244 domain-containing protein n=1 Tax=Bacteroides oleiciplenus YIT 12058 TaxID=742727 RepID=K9EJE5_9BACE|nr:DUF3244 domain-containing protein [Bacteroides oleiciplenus]EKU91072.1 hypothetical protein HMPREF9447_02490 [Bacteroides oleiciplenus YIT 12058]